jgi:hypothetical protein
MTRRLLALLLLSVIPAAAGAANRTYIITDFDSLRLEAPIDVAVETGRGISARGEGDGDVLERVELDVSARVLSIRLKSSPYEGRKSATSGMTRLVLTVPALRRIQLSGAGALRAKGLDRARAEILSAGSGSIAVTDIDSDTLNVALVGSGSVALAGKAKSVVMRVSGAGALDAKALSASDLDLRLDGAAAVAVKADRVAKIVAAGPGSILVGGKAACTVNHSGSGAVSCGGSSY